MSRGAEAEQVWPNRAGGAVPCPGLSLVVGRALGTVVVTVRGRLDLAGCERLGSLLTDLIEGQGNLTVAVDLGRAIVDPEALTAFITAAGSHRRHGTRLILSEPPTDCHQALRRSAELADVVEIVPRRG